MRLLICLLMLLFFVSSCDRPKDDFSSIISSLNNEEGMDYILIGSEYSCMRCLDELWDKTRELKDAKISIIIFPRGKALKGNIVPEDLSFLLDKVSLEYDKLILQQFEQLGYDGESVLIWFNENRIPQIVALN